MSVDLYAKLLFGGLAHRHSELLKTVGCASRRNCEFIWTCTKSL